MRQDARHVFPLAEQADVIEIAGQSGVANELVPLPTVSVARPVTCRLPARLILRAAPDARDERVGPAMPLGMIASSPPPGTP